MKTGRRCLLLIPVAHSIAVGGRMSFLNWADSRAKKMGWLDMSMVKIAVFAFALTAAKLWTPLLGLDWYWYAVICILASLKPLAAIWGK